MPFLRDLHTAHATIRVHVSAGRSGESPPGTDGRHSELPPMGLGGSMHVEA